MRRTRARRRRGCERMEGRGGQSAERGSAARAGAAGRGPLAGSASGWAVRGPLTSLKSFSSPAAVTAADNSSGKIAANTRTPQTPQNPGLRGLSGPPRSTEPGRSATISPRGGRAPGPQD